MGPSVNVPEQPLSPETRPHLLLACHECDLVSDIIIRQDREWHQCPRCYHALLRPAQSDQLTPALAFTALILLSLSLVFPYIAFEKSGLERAITVTDAANELATYHHPLLAVIVIATIIVIPAFYLLSVCWIHLGLAARQPLPGSLVLARWLPRLQPWMMADVFAIAALVSLVKIVAMAHVQLLEAFWTFTGYALLLLITVTRMNTISLWQRLLGTLLQPLGTRPGLTAQAQGLIGCAWCGQLQPLGKHHCLRCGSRLHERHPFTLQRVWALLITSVLACFPAHLYPIMVTTSLGQSEPSTIIGGVMLFLDHGDWPIALIIFTASVLVPFGKIFTIGWLCIAASQRNHTLDMASQMRLYRFTEWIGRWSMIDVFVVAIIVGLFQVGNILTIEPGLGGLAFSAVVIFTILAALQFDPRLIWDQLQPPTVSNPKPEASA